MNTKQYNHKTEIIHAMNVIMRSLNNEDAIETWLSVGVPDGLNTLDDIREAYDNDETFEDDFNDMTSLFCKIIQNEAITSTDKVIL